MVRERLKEVVDFARAESPYRNANKGWINDDVYLQWGSLPDQVDKEGNELIDIFIFWKPIQKFISILFLVVSISVIMVFLTINFAQGKFKLLLNTPLSLSQLNTVENSQSFEVSEIKQLDHDISSEKTDEVLELDQVDPSIDQLLEKPNSPSEEITEEINQITSPKQKKELGTAGNLF